MKTYRQTTGFSLIELTIFMVVLGLLASALLVAFRETLVGSGSQQALSRATHLAERRMELILAERQRVGFSDFTDPCDGSAATVCLTPTGYSVVTPTVSSLDANHKLILVHIQGPADVTLTTRVANY